MSHQNSISSLFTGENTDVTLARIGLVACLLLFSLRLLAEQILLVVIPLAGASACGLYLLTRRYETQRVEIFSYGGRIIGYLPSVVFLGLAAFVVLVRLTGGRSVATHLLAGAIGSCLLAQILLIDDHRLNPQLTLAQILLASTVIRFGALFGTPGFIGVDVWTHVPDFVAGIVDEQSLSAISDYKYYMAPIYHLNGAVAALIFDDARVGLFLSMGLVMALSSLAIYATSRMLLPARWALLATALYAFADEFVRWGIHIIPTSLGVVFFLGALYCLTKLYYRTDLRFLFLLFACTLAVVFTHQVSTAVILLLVGVAATISLLTSFRGRRMSQNLLRATGLAGVFTTSVTITLVSWANTPFSGDFIFLWRMLDVLEDQLSGAGFLNLAGGGNGNGDGDGDGGGGGGGGASAEEGGLIVELIPAIEWFGFGLLLAATILGAMILIRRSDSTELTLTYLLVFGGMFTVVYGFSLFGLRTFMPGRWLAFMYGLMSIMAAMGLYYVSQHAPRKVMVLIVLILAVGYPTTMLVAEKATLDSPGFEQEYPRFSYTEAEIGAVETIADIRPAIDDDEIEDEEDEEEAEVGTDHPYRTLYERVGGYETPDLVLDDGEPVETEVVVSRQYQHEGPTAVHEDGEPTITRQSNHYLSESVCESTRNRLYTNDVVTLCTTGEHP